MHIGRMHHLCAGLLVQRDLPYELDATLRTLGTTTLDGSINTPKAFFGAVPSPWPPYWNIACATLLLRP